MKTLHMTPGLTFRLLKKSASEWTNDNAMRLAAALSYYSVFSIAPLLLIAIGIAGIFFGEKAAQGEISAQLAKFIGQQAAEAMQAMVSSASQNGGGGKTVVGFVVLIFGASSVFGQLKEALNTIWGVKPKPGLGVMGLVKERLLSFGLVFGIGFLLLVSLMLTTALAAMNGMLENTLHLPKAVSFLVGFLLSFGVETLLFAVIFKVLPDAKVRWTNVWMGAIATALLFELGKMGLAWYLGQKSTTSPFGAAGSLVVLLLWVFYASCIVFFGAEFTKVYSAETGEEIKPSDVAEKVQTMEHAVIGAVPKVETEAHPLNPGAPVPPVPMRESLTPLLLSTEVESHALRELRLPRPQRIASSAPRTKVQEWIDQAHEHPVAEIGAAIGAGLLIGALSRSFDKQAPALSAADHFEQGSRKIAVATKSMALAAAGWLARHLTKKALRQYGKTAQKEGTKWTHLLAERVEKAVR